jgi:ABC-type enterochelin transport system ATPase subunit
VSSSAWQRLTDKRVWVQNEGSSILELGDFEDRWPEAMFGGQRQHACAALCVSLDVISNDESAVSPFTGSVLKNVRWVYS